MALSIAPTSTKSLYPPLSSSPSSHSNNMSFLRSIKRKVSSAGKTAHPANTKEYPTITDPYGLNPPPPPPRSQFRTPTSMRAAKQEAEAAAPPAYTAASNAQAASPVADDPYAFLGTFDTVFLIDDSGSMAGSRWRETQEALERITPVCTQHDADGIDIRFLNARDSPWHHNVTSAATVREIFSAVRPGGGTPTGQRLDQILRPYLRSCERNIDAVKPLNLIVITDGEPSDDVETPLIAAAKKLDRLDAPGWQVGVQFFQVGRDEQARKHLRQLDDELAEIAGEQIRDMVDTVPFVGEAGGALTADGILKVVLGAVNRRLDRKRSRELHR